MADQLQGPDGGNLESGTGAIDTNEAGSIFASMIGTEPSEPKAPAAKEPPKKDGEGDAKPTPEDEALVQAAAEEAANEGKEGDEASDDADAEKIFTFKMEGKEIKLTADELINGYKAQKVSTAKFEQAAEMRKAADAELARANAEIAAARQDRQIYAQNLHLLGQQVQSALQESAQVDMARLSVENPSEYVKQKHLQEQRQAQANQIRAEQIRIAQLQQAEQANAHQQWQAEQDKATVAHIQQQQEELRAKLPEWKDPAKAKAENEKIVSFLVDSMGYQPNEVVPYRDEKTGKPVYPITDHRVVLMARESMLYRQIMARAKALPGKVEKVPPKAERPGVAAAPTDGRTAAMQRLEKSGRVEDAGAIFAEMFK